MKNLLVNNSLKNVTDLWDKEGRESFRQKNLQSTAAFVNLFTMEGPLK